MAKKRFDRTARVFLRKGNVPAVIAEAMGSKKWKVELVDADTGEPTGTFIENLSSQALRHPKDDSEFPTPNRKEDSDDDDDEPTPAEVAATSEPGGEIEVVLDENNQLPTITEGASASDDESQVGRSRRRTNRGDRGC
ncbi:hypothetical protein SEMRO_675_G185590.1 [Seminavis robusta]|uniref:Uncharacterized protein n=1 Tax=Seminavis robusta TaxID=568900 RepID=A0A9N8E6K7_9STRA|nr:hypothetical protein SEMRO_675_G185590.1 [Seminavis robusta]|eukprot:Sro675_g185590.1 n/a (138) ;mRNA; f:51441-51937